MKTNNGLIILHSVLCQGKVYVMAENNIYLNTDKIESQVAKNIILVNQDCLIVR